MFYLDFHFVPMQLQKGFRLLCIGIIISVRLVNIALRLDKIIFATGGLKLCQSVLVRYTEDMFQYTKFTGLGI